MDPVDRAAVSQPTHYVTASNLASQIPLLTNFLINGAMTNVGGSSLKLVGGDRPGPS